jgi:hypothetical protein
MVLDGLHGDEKLIGNLLVSFTLINLPDNFCLAGCDTVYINKNLKGSRRLYRLICLSV